MKEEGREGRRAQSCGLEGILTRSFAQSFVLVCASTRLLLLTICGDSADLEFVIVRAELTHARLPCACTMQTGSKQKEKKSQNLLALCW